MIQEENRAMVIGDQQNFAIEEVNREFLPIGGESDNLMGWMKLLAEAPFYKSMGGLPAMAAIVLTGRELGVGPMASLNGGFWNIQGHITMSSEQMRAKFRQAGHSLILVTLTEEACTLKGVRKDNKDTCEMTFTMEDAKRAGLMGKNNWKTDPKSMLMASCSRKLIRFLAPELLAGTGMDEVEIACIEEDTTPKEPKKLDPIVGKFISDYNLMDLDSPASKFIDAICVNLTQDRDITLKQCAHDRERFDKGFKDFMAGTAKKEVETKPV